MISQQANASIIFEILRVFMFSFICSGNVESGMLPDLCAKLAKKLENQKKDAKKKNALKRHSNSEIVLHKPIAVRRIGLGIIIFESPGSLEPFADYPLIPGFELGIPYLGSYIKSDDKIVQVET